MILSLVTSIKDYVEIVNKFIEYDSVNINYTELGSILTFFLISIKNCFVDFFSFSWLLKENLWSLPIIIPQISSAMVSEISVLASSSYFHNTFNFLDTPVSYSTSATTANAFILCIEKLTIGLINSIFLFLPTSTAHIITLRRFVMQGLEAGYLAGLGTIAGNIFWLASVILGWRFFVIPWLSLDTFRYVLGFILLVKYMWDSYNEKTATVNTNVNAPLRGTNESAIGSFLNVLGNQANQKIFLLNFLLALTEQTSLYAFVGNISLNADTSLLETASINNSTALLFTGTHLSYLLGILLGSLSLLHFSCWFWENPAFKIYMWAISSFKISTNFYYKALNFGFLYLTMLSAICSIPYYGLDYAITNPLGYVNDDRIVQDKTILETSFLGTKASDRNTRRNRGRHGRRERWKRRIRKYRAFDASLYDQGIYDLFTVEDLNYGFDRFWLRRKLRNHRVRFRFFPGPWMRSFKKQLAKPRLESYTGPRIEFFRILFEQVYHPSFHAYDSRLAPIRIKEAQQAPLLALALSSVRPAYPPLALPRSGPPKVLHLPLLAASSAKRRHGLAHSYAEVPGRNTFGATSAKGARGQEVQVERSKERSLLEKNTNNKTKLASLRKFVRKFDTRIKKLKSTSFNINIINNNEKSIYSKQWKNFIKHVKTPNAQIKTKLEQAISGPVLLQNKKTELNNLSSLMCIKQKQCVSVLDALDEKEKKLNLNTSENNLSNKAISVEMLRYRLLQLNLNNKESTYLTNKLGSNSSMMLLHPLKFYLQKEAGFKRKMRYYTPNIYRKLSVENNAPYFRVMMRRYFYNYKPTLRWERTMKTASLRKARRKTTRIPRKLQNMKGSFSLQRSGATLSDRQSAGQAEVQTLQKDSFSTNQTNSPNALLQIAYKERNEQLPVTIVEQAFEKNLLQKSTYSYSVVSKRANRYRYEIYKDVLQHWYYSPFNRFLLKLDVDSFIRRQPNSHFLTAKEENLLHLRRFLLCEHYNTLRWYTNMQHYRTMKTQLNGGTKSFASRVYNQQFSGTFKKIRHLFAITPSFSNAIALGSSAKGATPTLLNNSTDNNITNEINILKFDQPLYNQYNNTSSNSILNPLVIHEELLPDFSFNASQVPLSSESTRATMNLPLGQDLVSQSQNIVGQYLTEVRSVRQDYIKKLLNENNYAELANFIYKGQKTRGSGSASSAEDATNLLTLELGKISGGQPVTNQKLFNEQEKNYLLTKNEQDSINNSKMLSVNQSNSAIIKEEVISNVKQTLYLQYLKNWKRHVNDQESLKNYLSRRLDKREKRKRKKEKQLITKLQRLENWFNQETAQEASASPFERLTNNKVSVANDEMLTSGLQKSVLDGMISLKNIDWQGKSTLLNKDCSLLLNSDLCKTQNLPFGKGNNINEKSLWKTLLLSKIKSTNETNHINDKSILLNKQNFVGLQNLTLRFNNLKYAKKIKLENNLKASVQAMREFVTLENKISNKSNKINQSTFRAKTPTTKSKFYNATVLKTKLASFNSIYLNLATQTAKNIYKKTKQLITSSKYLSLNRLITPLRFKQNKSLSDWRKNERVLNKQKKSRKEFKLLNKKVESLSTYVNRNDLQLAFDFQDQQNINSYAPPLRKKRIFEKNINQSSPEVVRLHEVQAQLTQEQNVLGQAAEEVNTLPSALRKLQQPVIFKRKRSAQRRSRVRRNRGVFKKRNLTDLLKKDFTRFYNNYNQKDSTFKNEYYAKFNSNLYSSSNSNLVASSLLRSKSADNKEDFFTANEQAINLFSLKNQEQIALKQRKAKQRKERYWKQKRSKYSQKRRKYRKRRAYTVVKIRALNKQFKRIKNQIEIQNWWWKQFIPSIQASNEALWQIEKDKLIQQKLSELSNTDILQRSNFNNIMQIGNNDFKPLALPYTIALQQQAKKAREFASSTSAERTTEVVPSAKRISGSNRPSAVLLRYSASSTSTEGASEAKQRKELPLLAASSAKRRHGLLGPLLLEPLRGSRSLPLRETPQHSVAEGKALFLERPEITENKENKNFVNKLYKSLFIDQLNNPTFSQGSSPSFSQFLSPNTNLPFYAGWDESLRKLVVTNRMLSRREAGFSLLSSVNSPPLPLSTQPMVGKITTQKEEFTLAPLQGMNAATTLYWQIPFTTYDPDQFFALGMDGFSPIGWRRFLLRHSLLKTWLNSNSNFNNNQLKQASQYQQLKGTKQAVPAVANTSNDNLNLLNNSNDLNKQSSLVVKTRSNILKDFSLLSGADKQILNLQNQEGQLLKYEQNKNSFAVARRLKKRYRRVKKHPRTPVWFPSGPLLNQVLPVHYIYVFYKRARLPRDRYIKRRLLNVKQMNSSLVTSSLINSSMNQSVANSTSPGGVRIANNLQTKQTVPNLLNYDFTLRKRLKPKRKYHLKRNYYASNVVIPRRFKFMSIYGSDTNIQKWRPLSILKINKPVSEIVKQQQLLRRSAQQRSAKQQPNMRVKQLRRRVQRQILRSVWRYRPRAGGFVWPGDYLKLELVKAPKLHAPVLTSLNIESSTNSASAAIRSKQNGAEVLTNQEQANTNVSVSTNENLAIKKQKRKKKRTLVEWQIQPKRYLREKHNLKVIKKKLLQRPFGVKR